MAIKRGIDLTTIKKLCQIFERMNFALLQIGWVNDGAITAAVEKFSPDDWLKKHAFISEEDFTKDRNRLPSSSIDFCQSEHDTAVS